MIALDPHIRIDRRGSCVPTAISCLPALEDGRDHVIEGKVRFLPNRRWHRHTWMLVDREIFDPSLVQFYRMRHYSPKEVEREEFLRFTPMEYTVALMQVESPGFWIRRLEQFGVDPEVLGEINVEKLSRSPIGRALRARVLSFLAERFEGAA